MQWSWCSPVFGIGPEEDSWLAWQNGDMDSRVSRLPVTLADGRPRWVGLLLGHRPRAGRR